MKYVMLICIVLGFTVSLLHAIPTMDGENDANWDEKHYSVIVAKVRSVEQAQDTSWKATLVPMGTIAGKFDASEHPELQVDSYGPAVSSVGVLPKAGDTVLTAVVVSQAPGRGWVIPISYMPFMPSDGGAALCVIDGPADPRVVETLEKIQQARIRGRAERAAATQPTTQPDK